MGGLFGDVTKTGVVQPNGQAQFYDNPAQAGVAEAQAMKAGAQPSVAVSNAEIPEVGAADNSKPSFMSPEPKAQPRQVKPSLNEAAKDQYGNFKQVGPSETKLGKFLHILGAAAEGAATGAGQRSFGAGFQAAQMAPFQRAQAMQQQQMGQLEVQKAQQEQQLANTPVEINGQQVPWAVAQRQIALNKANLENAVAGSAIRKNNAEAGAKEQDKIPSLQIQHSQAVQKAIAEGRDPNSDPMVQTLADQITSLQKQSQPKELGRDDKAIAIEQKRQLGQPLTPDEVAYEKAYKAWVKENKIDPGVQRAQMFVMGRPVQVIDPNNPENVTYTTAGQAIKSGATAPSSIPFQTDKGIQKAFTTGKPAEELAAFNTAIQHADLLKQAATALKNNDIRTLNSIKNRLKTEFGSSDVTNFNVIANAYSREVTKALSAGHITDNEIKEQGATIPPNASPDQIMGAVQAYRNLMKSKVDIRKQQYESGRQGKPNFGSESGNNDSGWTVVNGIRVKRVQ